MGEQNGVVSFLKSLLIDNSTLSITLYILTIMEFHGHIISCSITHSPVVSVRYIGYEFCARR